MPSAVCILQMPMPVLIQCSWLLPMPIYICRVTLPEVVTVEAGTPHPCIYLSSERKKRKGREGRKEKGDCHHTNYFGKQHLGILERPFFLSLFSPSSSNHSFILCRAVRREEAGSRSSLSLGMPCRLDTLSLVIHSLDSNLFACGMLACLPTWGGGGGGTGGNTSFSLSLYYCFFLSHCNSCSMSGKGRNCWDCLPYSPMLRLERLNRRLLYYLHN